MHIHYAIKEQWLGIHAIIHISELCIHLCLFYTLNNAVNGTFVFIEHFRV